MHASAVKRHLLILLALTILVRGVMFVSYPLSASDDNQSAQRYLIDELLGGNLHIGNLRYPTGYALAISPVVALSRLFGRFDERFVLLVQITLSAAIPFLIYDILRSRRSPNEAFAVALLALLDPFGLQWAHFWLPEWMIAFCLVLALWLIHRALIAGVRLRLVTAAGVVLALAVLARLNFAPIVVVFGLTFFGLRTLSWRTRLRMFVTLGVSSAAVLAIYFAAIHYPTTGTWTPSCIGGWNLMNDLQDKHIPITAANGPAAAELTRLLTLKASQPVEFLGESYVLWRNPGPWATEVEQTAFFNQPSAQQSSPQEVQFPGDLIYHMGPCAVDRLFSPVYVEAALAYPREWITGSISSVWHMLTQTSANVFDVRYLPSRIQGDSNRDSGGRFGFVQADDGNYNGQWVWTPGMRLYSWYFRLNLIKWLVPAALLWALLSRKWFYASCALMLITFVAVTAVITQVEPRYYSAIYPLYPMLLGGFLVAVSMRVKQWLPKPSQPAASIR
jgi:4-amino-4-deoxy-L-arabinose transferase-like glycosyltransferase